MLDAGLAEDGLHRTTLAGDPTNWWAPNHAACEAMLRSAGFASSRARATRSTLRAGASDRERAVRPPTRRSTGRPWVPWAGPAPTRPDGGRMIEAVKFWNEPNNLSHWDFQLDPEWRGSRR